MNKTKRSLFTSAISLLLCFSMLIGTTFAWFTDTASSEGNVIQTGSLKVGLHLLEKDGSWRSIKEDPNPIYSQDILWEPGYTDVKILKVSNDGSLALKWKAKFVSDVELSALAEVIDVYVNPNIGDDPTYPTGREAIETWQHVGTLDQFVGTLSETTYGFLAAGDSANLGIALKMQESAGNDYQDKTLGEFTIQILATQAISENDSFGDDYDKDAAWPELEEGFTTTASLAQVPTVYGELANDLIIRYSDSVYALLPAGTKLANGVSELKFSGKPVENGSNITLGDGDSAQSYDIHIEGIAADNQKPITVYLGAILDSGLGETELKLYHEDALMTRVGSVADFGSENQFFYDSETGDVVLYVTHFSVFSAVKTSADVWDGEAVADGFASGSGTEADPYLIETAAQLVYFRNQVDAGVTYAGKFVKLNKDIDLYGIPFDPIGFGYWKEGKIEDGVDKNTVFMGTFDGGNHTIYNLYQNCWELDPDKTNYSTYTYSTAGAGLFASIKDATIKNLAISGAEVVFECVDMGIVVGYAQGECHFENIVVTNANIANYNRYTGGLVGEVSYGPYGTDTTLGYSHTFKNITIDSTVKVSGLWGSFGCGMGGVIGGKWNDATVYMENVISAAEMDVYNDVVSAYQWYAFRGCGMLIGHTEEPESDGRKSGNATASFLTCKNVKVYYGDWVNYTYYEFANQDNGTGRNYPWVRAEAGEYCDAFSNIRYGVPTHEGVKVSDLTKEELEKVATNYTPIVFDQLYGADRGMYGQAKHDGVTVIYGLGETKTIYIYNDQDWENLKLHYWYRNGDDTWTNVSEDGVSMDNMELSNFENVYRLRLPAYVDGLRITADNEEEIEFTLADLENDGIYTLGGEAHEHEYVGGKCACGAYSTSKWQLVTAVTDLNAGDKIVIVAKNSNYALSTTQNKNNRGQVLIVKNGDDTLTIDENVQIITLEAGTSDNTFAFNVGNGYLYAASSGDNYLRTETTLSANGSWTISIAQNASATIKAQGTNTRNLLKYNSNSSLFSCYSSGQQEVVIYKLTGQDGGATTPHNCLEYATGATCTDNATCTKCAQVIPNTAFGHNYESVVTEATCTKGGYTTHTCSRCGDDYVTDETDAFGHSFDGNSCSVCGEEKPQVGGTKTYTFSNYTAGTQYAVGEEHVLDENTTIVTTQCHFTTELRIYASSTHNGYAIIKSANPITSISVNAGDNKDILVIYGSNDEGKTWTEIATVEVESSYADYSVKLANAYQWIKIDVEGSNQVRLKSMTLTTGEPCEHTNTTTTTVDATCTEAGYTVTKCTDCDAEISRVAGDPATGHVNTTETTVDATCTEAGSITVTCDGCGVTVSTEAIDALGHTTENGTCERCGETIGGTTEPSEPEVVATFEFGANGSASHADGTSKTSYSETNNGYTLTLSSMTNIYTGARDAKGNSCIKLGASSKAGSFSFTVGDDVTKVIIYVAQYKANTTKITVNGTSYTITTASNNGAYTAIEIDTSTTKTVTFTTVSGGYRAMVNTIKFLG